MIFRLAGALLVAISATQVAAEDVRVLSGEHDQFSRIVLVFRQPVEWEQQRTDSGFSIAFSRSNLALDLTRVFDLIPRDRIDTVSFDSSSSTLTLGSDCGCGMEVFLAGKNTVAIDISSPSQPVSAFSTGSNNTPIAAHLPFGLLHASQTLPGAPNSPYSTALDLNGAATERGAESGNQVGVPLQIRGDVQSLEAALMQQLGRAASQGLISARMPDERSVSPDTTFPHTAQTSSGRNAAHVLAGSVFDQHASTSASLTPTGDESKPACIDPSLVDPSLWKTGDTAEWDIGAARSETLNDLDVPEADAVTRLVKTYLALGFGAEARAVIDEFTDLVPTPQIFEAIAAVLDDMDGSHLQALLGQESCAGPPAIWGVLASPDATQLRTVDVASIQDSFFRFPANLRNQLGPKLARNLMDAGHSDVASAIVNATRRSALVPSPELVVLEATTQLSPRTRATAQEKMIDVLAADDSVAAEALIEILTQAVKTGRVDPEDVLLAEAMASERRNTPFGIELLSTAAVARANLGEFHAAFLNHAEIGASSASQNDIGPDSILSEILDKVVQFEDDAFLLRFLQRTHAGQTVKNLSDDTISLVARRLVEIDLSKEAERILASRQPDSSVQGRELMASVALAENDPSLALTILAGEDHPEGLAIRAKALSDLENHAIASKLFEEHGDISSAKHEAWLSGEPNRIRAVGSPDEVALATRRETEHALEANRPDLANERVTLETSRVRVERSREMRDMLTSLLEDGRR